MIINKNIITKKVIFHPLEDINIKKILHSEEPETFEYFIWISQTSPAMWKNNGDYITSLSRPG